MLVIFGIWLWNVLHYIHSLIRLFDMDQFISFTVQRTPFFDETNQTNSVNAYKQKSVSNEHGHIVA